MIYTTKDGLLIPLSRTVGRSVNSKTIIDQLGGRDSFDGIRARTWLHNGDGLIFTVGRGNEWKVTVKLEQNDTYSVEVGRVADSTYAPVAQAFEVYAGQLRETVLGAIEKAEVPL
jgi:hypothetical protein